MAGGGEVANDPIERAGVDAREDAVHAGPRKRKQALQGVHPHCAGIDIGKTRHSVAAPEEADERAVRSFASFTDELLAMAAWLRSCGVDTVAMQATGVYWIAVFEELDRAGMEVHLVDARATKQVSGRKSDVLDCQWIS